MGLFDLFRPKWRHSAWNVRQKAITHIEDQTILAQIARKDPYSTVRQEAIKKLENRTVLAYVARTDSFNSVRNEALSRLNYLVWCDEVDPKESWFTTNFPPETTPEPAIEARRFK